MKYYTNSILKIKLKIYLCLIGKLYYKNGEKKKDKINIFQIKFN